MSIEELEAEFDGKFVEGGIYEFHKRNYIYVEKQPGGKASKWLFKAQVSGFPESFTAAQLLGEFEEQRQEKEKAERLAGKEKEAEKENKSRTVNKDFNPTFSKQGQGLKAERIDKMSSILFERTK